MNLLAIDTAGPVCSVALRVADAVIEDTRRVERRHNEVLLPMLEGLFDAAVLRPRDVDTVCFNAGPASFTGVRLAAATAQAVAYAADARVLPIRSSAVLAEGALPGDGQAVTSVRSRAALYYLALYERTDGLLTCVREDELVDAPPAWLPAGLPLVGDAPPWLAGVAPLRPEASPASSLLARAAAQPQSAYLPPERALPVYVQGDNPWQS